uniref:segment polarity protein dishevelled homolog DVL-3 n=1 Tax=Doryrhamphus excisus TaxID=161450 RepID=UPI0025AEC52A|nr:segment polarity protein dishevelled homolog DVL-3 [Doryrhamphus excisus]XP_057936532.1 segment polarity protein dishevelled homolog DVL-3 [Doryrhamphus excisus]
MERCESVSSVSDSSMSINMTTVTLDMEKYHFLGVNIVAQDNGDGAVYIGSIMDGGAVAADGRIDPGDMLLQVNDINLENATNEHAVQVLRDVVRQPGTVTLTVVKCWNVKPPSVFRPPKGEPVRPIDPASWVSHTTAMAGKLLPYYGEDEQLSVHSDMAAVVMAMMNADSGLEVRDRMWLKIIIPNAFIGSDVVHWLHRNLQGFTDRREARRYAAKLLKRGYIRHAFNKVTFSEQRYYVLGDLAMTALLDRHEDAYLWPLPQSAMEGSHSSSKEADD